MSASFLHIATSFIPLYFGGAAFIINTAGKVFHTSKLLTISYWFYLVTGLFTTITCAFGGASIRAVESAPGIDQFIVKTHAWTAALVFLVSVAMLVFSVRLIREKGDRTKSGRMLTISSILFLFIFLITVYFANKIK